MPHHPSAEKRVRQSAKRRAHNRYYKVMMRNALKAVRTAGTREDLVEKVRQATRVLDRLAVKGIIHRNFAANRKSQMARMVANYETK